MPLPPEQTAAPGPPEIPGVDIMECIGQGAFGAVYKGRQRDLDRLVAVKVMNPGLALDESFVARFMNEARAGAP
jgi:serine/threonine protein kinase